MHVYFETSTQEVPEFWRSKRGEEEITKTGSCVSKTINSHEWQFSSLIEKRQLNDTYTAAILLTCRITRLISY